MIEYSGGSQGWNAITASMPAAHILQTAEWGLVKAEYGWKPLPHVWLDAHGKPQAAALVLERTLPLVGFSARMRVMYVPRGPLLDWSDGKLRAQILTDLVGLAKKRRAIFIKIDPELVIGYGIPGTPDAVETETGRQALTEFQAAGWRYSESQVQFKNSAMIDLSVGETALLAGMKQKSRYNLKLAQRKGVTVRKGSAADIPLLYRMYAETSVRDGFVIRAQDYYAHLWKYFIERCMATPLIAEVEGEAVAGLILFHFAGRAWYLYGMSTGRQRERMPNYLLQWEAMLTAREAGCHAYDLWGAPDVFDESDSMWNVYRFKEGLGAAVMRTAGAWDYPVSPWLYSLTTRTLPRILDVMRRRRKAGMRQEVAL